METPNSSRRITRSQTKAAGSAMAVTNSDSVKGLMESRQRVVNQPALFDITNDSPVFGLAMVEISKLRSGYQYNNREITTPGSGEALLRNQVKKILLQKVEEEAELLSKISMVSRRFLGFNSMASSDLQDTKNEIVIDMDKGGEEEGFGSKKELVITRSLLPEFLDESAEDHDGSPEKKNQDGNGDLMTVNEFCEYFIKKVNINQGGGGGEKTSDDE